MQLSPIEMLIARKLRNGPKFVRSFQPAKMVVTQMVKRGLIRRVAGEGNKGKTMIELTEAGESALG